MTATLKELLTEYAEQARPYEVREQALRLGRRRRRLRVAVPAALAAMSVVATGLTLLTVGPRVAPSFAPLQPSHVVDPSPQQTDWPAVPSLPPVVIEELDRVSLPGYLAEIVTDPDAPPLPADRAAGRGLYLYSNPAGPWYGLVTESGAQYRLGPLDGPGHEVSPGGRWLLTHSRAEATLSLRDLTGTTVAALPDPDAPVVERWWSIDDRWLVTAGSSDGPVPPDVVTLVDLSRPTPEPREIDLRRWSGFAPAAVRADGTVVLRPVDGTGLGDVVLVDPETGDGRTVSIDLSRAAMPYELRVTTAMEALIGRGSTAYPLRLLPDGSAVLQLWGAFGGTSQNSSNVMTDVLVLDLDAGVVRERWRLPEPRPITGDPQGDWESWSVKTALPEGVLLTHSSTQRRLAWELYDPATGTLSLVTDLRGLASVRPDECPSWLTSCPA